MTARLYDAKCYELAKHFLSDSRGLDDEDVQKLAQAIQDLCEEHCQMIEARDRGERGIDQ